MLSGVDIKSILQSSQAPVASLDYASLLDIPISVNCQRGDPCQSNQFGDTCNKLRELTQVAHSGPVAVISKAKLTTEILKTLKEINPHLWLFISITGLAENRALKFSDIERMYLEACNELPNTCAYIRPIIPGQNDIIPMLTPIVKLAARGKAIAIARGYKDIAVSGMPYTYDPNFHKGLQAVCKDNGVKLFEKTSCAVSSVTGRPCSAHGNIELQTASVSVLRALGYSFIVESGEILLDPRLPWTRGDVNFIRMLCGRQPVISQVLDTSRLSLSLNEISADCTSSWFTWVRRVPCEIGCDYCFAVSAEGKSEVGCNPINLKDAICKPYTKIRNRVPVTATTRCAPLLE